MGNDVERPFLSHQSVNGSQLTCNNADYYNRFIHEIVNDKSTRHKYINTEIPKIAYLGDFALRKVFISPLANYLLRTICRDKSYFAL